MSPKRTWLKFHYKKTLFHMRQRPKKIWFDRHGQPKIKDSGNYDLSVCESYCNRKRNPWREVKTLEEVKKLYV